MAFADDLGYSETWVGEHFNVPWENMPSPELFIARALGVTKQMSFGIGVAQLHYHNPIHVAHRIAMLDHMSRGRIYLGIGSTGAPIDMEMFGVDPKAGSPRERMEEAIEVILRIWRAEPFEHRGRFFNATLPEPQPEARLGFHMTPYQTPIPRSRWPEASRTPRLWRWRGSAVGCRSVTASCTPLISRATGRSSRKAARRRAERRRDPSGASLERCSWRRTVQGRERRC